MSALHAGDAVSSVPEGWKLRTGNATHRQATQTSTDISKRGEEDAQKAAEGQTRSQAQNAVEAKHSFELDIEVGSAGQGVKLKGTRIVEIYCDHG